MACRVGITKNLEERKEYWKSKHPDLRNWTVLARNLTYDEAQEKEDEYKEICQTSPGGPRDNSSDWNVYYFEYD